MSRAKKPSRPKKRLPRKAEKQSVEASGAAQCLRRIVLEGQEASGALAAFLVDDCEAHR